MSCGGSCNCGSCGCGGGCGKMYPVTWLRRSPPPLLLQPLSSVLHLRRGNSRELARQVNLVRLPMAAAVAPAASATPATAKAMPISDYASACLAIYDEQIKSSSSVMAHSCVTL